MQSLIWNFSPGYAREPILRRMGDGSLACLFLTGGPSEPDNRNVVMISRSGDDGATWRQPQVLFSHSRRGVWATEMFTEGETPFIFVHTYDAQSHYRELQTFWSHSLDGGVTWGEPVSLPSGVNGVSVRQGIVLQSGAWVFPVYWQETTFDFDWTRDTSAAHPGVDRFPFRCGVMISWDAGKTFSRHGCIGANHGLWEPNCIEVAPDRLLMLMRDKASGYLVASESMDGGLVWTPPARTNIPNPNTKLTLLKVQKALLLINNFTTERGMRHRTHLQIRRSLDGGRTWTRPYLLADEGENLFYPHAFADDAARCLYVAYENGHAHWMQRIPYTQLGLQ